MTHKHRAYATLEIKAIDEDKRTIEGIATTNVSDRMDDIVEPKGAEFKLPLPLLWQHDSEKPIGWVESAKVTSKGIQIKARLAAEGVLDEIDRAWTLIKQGLVRGLSIGFRPLKDGIEEIEGSWGLRFTKWEWLELSAVTIPANQEATITSVKAYAERQSLGVALDAKPAGSGTVRLTPQPPGAAGSVQRKGKSNMAAQSIADRIKAFEAKRAADAAALAALVSGEDEGASLDDDQKAEYDRIDAEIKETDEHLRRLKRAEQVQLVDAQRIKSVTPAPDDPEPTLADGQRAPARQVVVRSNLPPGTGFARFAMAMYRANGSAVDAANIIRSTPAWRDQQNALLALCQKTAVPAADTTTSGWASQLAYASDLANEFIEYLRPRTIIGQIPNWRGVPFNVRMGSLTGGLTGYWVGQGKPIPVSKGTTGSTSLAVTKVAAMAALDEELMRLSTPSAEQLVRDELAAASIAIIDVSLIDPNQGGTANIQPASLTYGVTPVTATGTNYAAVSADMASMLDTVNDADVDPSDATLVMTPQQALKLSMMVTSLGVAQFPAINMTGGSLFGMRVVTSRHVGSITGSPDYGDMIVLILPREVFLADDGSATIEASREASIELLDNPTNTSTGATAATSMVSMFQTHSTALKAVRFVNWTKRRSVACQFIRNAAYA